MNADQLAGLATLVFLGAIGLTLRGLYVEMLGKKRGG